jgi:hypothetical protein
MPSECILDSVEILSYPEEVEMSEEGKGKKKKIEQRGLSAC